MKSTTTALEIVSALLAFSYQPSGVEAHGVLTGPRSRNWRASQTEDGIGNWYGCEDDRPMIDYNYPALNENESILGSGVATSACGITQRSTGQVFDYVP